MFIIQYNIKRVYIGYDNNGHQIFSLKTIFIKIEQYYAL